MPLTPTPLLPRPASSELAVGTVQAANEETITVQIRPGLVVTLPGQGYMPGTRVVLALPGGKLPGAQVIGPAMGHVSTVVQVLV